MLRVSSRALQRSSRSTMAHHLQRQDSRGTLPTTSYDCDVVKRGPLYVKRFPAKRTIRIGIKTWQKKHLVLRDDWKESGKTTLDIYDRESDAAAPPVDNNTRPSSAFSSSSLFFSSSSSSRPSFTVDLRSVVNVDVYLESRSFAHALLVDRSDGPSVVLGAQSDLEMRGWLAAIKLLADKAYRLRGPRIHRPPSCPAHLANDVTKPARALSLSLMSKLNLSTPQLFKFARGRAASSSTRHLSIDRELSLSSNLSKPSSSGSFVDAVGGDSTPSSAPRTPVLSDCHPPVRRISKTPVTNYANHKESGSKWLSFSKTIRKDSGFSESFDDSVDQFQSTYSPPQDTVEEEDDCCCVVRHPLPSSSSSTPPPPPLPPRQLSSPFSPSPRSTAFCQEPWFAVGFTVGPPRPPPRPLHTLLAD